MEAFTLHRNGVKQRASLQKMELRRLWSKQSLLIRTGNMSYRRSISVKNEIVDLIYINRHALRGIFKPEVLMPVCMPFICNINH